MTDTTGKDALRDAILKAIDERGSIQLSIFEAAYTGIAQLVGSGELIYYDAYQRGQRFVVEVSRPGFDGNAVGHDFKQETLLS